MSATSVLDRTYTTAHLPVAPLVRAVNYYLTERGLNLNSWDRSMQRAWFRAVKSGKITVWSADKVCVDGLGLHPCVVYGNLWWAAIA